MRGHDGGRPAIVVYFVCAFYLYVAVALLTWACLPVLTGMVPTLIVSGSMEPRIHAGDVVLVASANGTEVAAGAVVTFDDPAHEGRLLTHRVVGVNPDGTLRTRGDANAQADSTAVDRARVRGVGKVLVPAVGVPLMWIRAQAWLQLVVWAGGTLFAASYLRLYGRRIPIVSSWSSALRPAPEPARKPAPARPGRASWEAPVVRRRVRPGIATAVIAAVAVLAVAAVVAPQAVASEAAFTAAVQNSGNDLRALTVQPPTGFTVTQQCTQSAAVTFRAATDAQGQGGSQTLSTPAGVAAGDVLLAQIVTRDNVALTPPNGWTFLRKDGTGPFSSIYYRVATAGEPASATWTSASVRWAGGMGAWSGADGAAPIVTTSGTAGTLAAPSVTTTRPNQTLVAFYGQNHTAGFTPPAGMAERWDRASAQSGSPPQQVGSGAADEPFTAVGATGTRTATGSGSAFVAQMVVLDRPADTYQGSAQWTATTTTSATGYTLQRSRAATVEATYDVTPPTTVSQLDTGLAAATTYSYTLAAYRGSWTSANATGTLTTSAYCP